eukprot:365837-Chlamydomonas_euryale.AAC.7
MPAPQAQRQPAPPPGSAAIACMKQNRWSMLSRAVALLLGRAVATASIRSWQKIPTASHCIPLLSSRCASITHLCAAVPLTAGQVRCLGGRREGRTRRAHCAAARSLGCARARAGLGGQGMRELAPTQNERAPDVRAAARYDAHKRASARLAWSKA